MFTPQQMAYLNSLAQQSAGNTLVSYNYTQLMVRQGNLDVDREGAGVFFFLVGVFLLFILFISSLIGDWRAIIFTLLFGAGMGWLAWRELDTRRLARRRLPVFIFDAEQHCFYLPASDSPQLIRYASHSLTDSRVRILESTSYYDDTVVELRFGEGEWLQALRLNTSPLAYELRRAIQKLAEM